MTTTFTPLSKGFVPSIRESNKHKYLLPEWLQLLFDSRWSDSGQNGVVYAASIEKIDYVSFIETDPKTFDVTLYRTSIAVCAARNEENRFLISDTGKSREGLERSIKLLHTRHEADDIIINARIDGDYFVVNFEFKTLSFNSFGLVPFPSGKKGIVAGYDHKQGVSLFGGDLNVPDLYAHAERQIFNQSGCNARNLQVIGVVFDDPCSYNFVGVFDIDSKKEARRCFKRRKDSVMKGLVFTHKSGLHKLSRHSKQWSPLAAAAKRALSL